MNILLYALALIGALHLLTDLLVVAWLWWFWKHAESGDEDEAEVVEEALRHPALARSRKKEKRPMAG